MSQKSSTFVRETRERESWITSAGEREASEGADGAGMLATAALVRGTLEAIPVPEEAEERSRTRAVAYMDELRRERLTSGAPQAPWFLRLGHAMRVVFTFWRRR